MSSKVKTVKVKTLSVLVSMSSRYYYTGDVQRINLHPLMQLFLVYVSK